MTRTADLPGSPSVAPASGVAHIDPAPSVCEAMPDGWAMQQRFRFLKAQTIQARVDLVRRLAAFTNEYPWQ